MDPADIVKKKCRIKQSEKNGAEQWNTDIPVKAADADIKPGLLAGQETDSEDIFSDRKFYVSCLFQI